MPLAPFGHAWSPAGNRSFGVIGRVAQRVLFPIVRLVLMRLELHAAASKSSKAPSKNGVTGTASEYNGFVACDGVENRASTLGDRIGAENVEDVGSTAIIVI